MGWQEWLGQHKLTLVLENHCTLCRRSTDGLMCASCQQRLLTHQRNSEAQYSEALPRVFAWGQYEGELKRAIAVLKYDRQPQIGTWLGWHLAQAWQDHGLDQTFSKLIVVPIPLAPGRLQRRGYNQAEWIARAFSTQIRYPLQVEGLVRARETQAQCQVTGQERERNLAGAFQVGRAFSRSQPKHPVLLIDDIYTTGATIRAATAALHRAGIRVWGTAVLARPAWEGEPTAPNRRPKFVPY